MLKPDLVAAIAARSGISRRNAAEVLTSLTDEIVDALARDVPVRLTGLGTFTVLHSPPRCVRDPRNGSPLHLKARRRVVFRPGALLRRAVNEEIGDPKETPSST